MAAVPPAPAADSWVDNPNVGNFNPGKKYRALGKVVTRSQLHMMPSEIQLNRET